MGAFMDEKQAGDRPTDSEITERFPMTTVMSAFCLWHKWSREEREFTQNEVVQLVGEILWQMMVSWVSEISETSERREVTSEFISDVYALAVMEVEGGDQKEIARAAIEGLHKKRG